MKRSIEKTVLIYFLLVVGLLLIVGLLAYDSLRKITQSNEDVLANYEILYHSEQIVSSVKDLENGSRGFALTGDISYQQPFFVALQRIEDNVSKLASTTTQGDIDDDLIRIKGLIDPLIEINKQIIQTVKDSTYAPSDMNNLLLEGKVHMDSLRRLGRYVNDVQLSHLQTFVEDQERALRTAFIFIIILFLIIAAVMTAIFFTLRNDVIGRNTAEMKLKGANQELASLNQNLESQIDERTDQLRRSYEELELKVKFRNLELQREVAELRKKLSDASGSL